MVSAITLSMLLNDDLRVRQLDIVRTFIDECFTDQNRIVDIDFQSNSKKWTLSVFDHDGKKKIFSAHGDGDRVEGSKQSPRITQLVRSKRLPLSGKGSKMDLVNYAYKIEELGFPSQVTYSKQADGGSLGISNLRSPKPGKYEFVYGRDRLITYSKKRGYRLIKGF